MQVAPANSPTTFDVGSIPSSQFRSVASMAGSGAVTLVPIDAPERVLFAAPDGSVRLAQPQRDRQFVLRSSFVREDAGRDTVRFVLAGRPGMVLGHVDGGLRLVARTKRGQSTLFRVS